jgi:hypothetical protein
MNESERVVREFHERQRRFYDGGEAEPLRAMLTEDIVWHVLPFDQYLFDEVWSG